MAGQQGSKRTGRSPLLELLPPHMETSRQPGQGLASSCRHLGWAEAGQCSACVRELPSPGRGKTLSPDPGSAAQPRETPRPGPTEPTGQGVADRSPSRAGLRSGVSAPQSTFQARGTLRSTPRAPYPWLLPGILLSTSGVSPLLNPFCGSLLGPAEMRSLTWLPRILPLVPSSRRAAARSSCGAPDSQAQSRLASGHQHPGRAP